MKTSKIILFSAIISALVLGACAPVSNPIEPYPVDQNNEPGEVSDANGTLAYILDPQADPEAVKELAQSSNGFALALYQALQDESLRAVRAALAANTEESVA